MGVGFRFPWEPVPLEEIVAALQRDMQYMVSHTCVQVWSNNESLRWCVNAPRSLPIPTGRTTFSDGTFIELINLGMPQVGIGEMTVSEIIGLTWDSVRALGLTL